MYLNVLFGANYCVQVVDLDDTVMVSCLISISDKITSRFWLLSANLAEMFKGDLLAKFDLVLAESSTLISRFSLVSSILCLRMSFITLTGSNSPFSH